ncbi:multiple monosaccharide ABC transporter ATP-binding protein [Clostridium estertheticum]|uniref:Sugar ABC transporter ATP-binding protein n=3 Tax=Clostridium estertheticum TaxID=238834 RepID=A0A7Y3T0G8_9CLOT|nr:multiple monosaccharide ABC transporter ATP-binding protein [Clostridium estertheticum]NNU78785.1 sugar ABC transporter ATP-binding protein [Clostridium estertheticum]WBL46691.1 sugar ABC transporter ATP-binding protein [Clostridium estertheticum]WBL46695.1 sugar ABC transporter ATP-binding protein [Clostridium estertheticum]WBL46697.1 sugar ABC transporter ATP-binding protein [Clostridium estertheticum]WLC69266.1 sugar ABC transporter ATP-binding protein [Clostridium estertheticum]
MSDIILEMKNITKTFPGVKALDDVNLKVKKGEIHALCGENGAGKSTLMKVLSGVYPHGTYTGDILFEEKLCEFKDIKQSEHLGIVIIHQELALISTLSIAENIFLGNERASNGVVDWNETTRFTIELLKKVGLNELPNTLVKNISVGKQQLVEIAKALSKEVKLLILDEPTAALNEEDSNNLLDLIVGLKSNGITSILISHKLNEISKVADSITILRDGATIETLDTKTDKITENRIIKGMVGRELVNRYPIREPKIGEVVFEVKNWNAYHHATTERKVCDNVNINIRKGEVVGIAGLMGAGRTELAMSVFGKSYGRNISGQIFKDGKEINASTISKAIENGIAYVTEDRKEYGLVLIDHIKGNMTLANLKRISKHGVINENQEIVHVKELCKSLNVKCSGILQKTGNLSGGNQQKVILSKWIFAEPDILMLDEPTRGIDVGAKYEIYTIINRLVNEGKSILFISSELPELLGMCDRIYVMNQSKIIGELSAKEASQEKIMKMIITQGQGV